MANLTRRAFFRQFLLGSILLLVLGQPGPCLAQLRDYLQFPRAFPERDIVAAGGGSPDWKMDWDNGRRLFRAGDYRRAVESYQRLLLAKANIAEARWELVMLLAELDEWEKARNELELLVETTPDNVEYLNALGIALRHTGQFGRSLDIFSKIRERFPDNFTALVGQTLGFLEAVRKKEALPLLQEVASKKPEDQELSLALATLAFEQGQMELARRLLVNLAAGKKVEIDTFVLAARVHDAMGKEKEAAGYWEKALAVDPANRQAHGWLAGFQDKQGRPDKALPHLQALFEQEPRNVSILGRICRFYLGSSGRFAEAVPYYEKYVRLRPADHDFIRAVIAQTAGRDREQTAFFRLLLTVSPEDLGVFTSLAADWQAAGDFLKSLEMWERLSRVVPERLEPYRALVPLLENLGREARLLEVLETIHRLAPDDQAVIGRLARLMVSRRELTAGLAYYNKLELAGYRGSDLYAGRASLYEELGQYSRALADHKKFLIFSPGDKEVLRRCLVLAGELGDVDFLVQSAAALEGTAAAGEIDEIMLLAEAFARTRDLSRAARYYRRVLAGSLGTGEGGSAESTGEAAKAHSHRARLGLAQLYRRESLPFEAEQILREGLLHEADQGAFLSQLFSLALAENPPDLDNARVWLEQYFRLAKVAPAEASFLEARLLAASGERDHAEEILRRLFRQPTGAGDQTPAVDNSLMVRRSGLLLAGMLLEDGDLPAAEQQCLAIPGAETDHEVLALLHGIYLRAGENKAADEIVQGILHSDQDAVRLLQFAELLQQKGLAKASVAVVDKVLLDWPDSLRAGFVKAEALIKEGKFELALKVASALAERFHDSFSVAALRARVYYHSGQYREAIPLCQKVLASEPDRFDIRFLMVWCEMAQGNEVEATRQVQELYPEEGSRFLAKLLTDAGLPLPPPGKRSLWQILTFARSPSDLAGEMLKAGAFFDQSLPERRKVNELVTAMSVWLRWEKSFRAALVGG